MHDVEYNNNAINNSTNANEQKLFYRRRPPSSASRNSTSVVSSSPTLEHNVDTAPLPSKSSLQNDTFFPADLTTDIFVSNALDLAALSFSSFVGGSCCSTNASDSGE